jgi:DNA-binding MarR family transcriptional regulator
MGFARASGVDPATASRIRDELQRAGVIEIVTGREQGAIREQQIRLTPLGREIGHHVVAIQEALDRAERRAQRGR